MQPRLQTGARYEQFEGDLVWFFLHGKLAYVNISAETMKKAIIPAFH